MPNKFLWYRRRRYLHFDTVISLTEAKKLVADPNRVKSHSFYPLIYNKIVTKKVKHDGDDRLTFHIKERRIHTASHRDSLIYSYYAKYLLNLYEARIAKNKLNNVVQAFRKINIDNVKSAKNVFDEIRNHSKCTVLRYDLTNFFGTIPHQELKRAWCQLLNVNRLPDDHYRLFQNITRYSEADRDQIYAKLNISRHNPNPDGRRRRLCDSKQFRRQIIGDGLVRVNRDNYGIPQGVSISTVLSNIFMLDIDLVMQEEIEKINGQYFRYCDDIIIIVPHAKDLEYIESTFVNLINSAKLSINNSKTSRHEFWADENKKIMSDKPLQYLGITFDGERFFIRPSSLARFQRKMRRGVRLAYLTKVKYNHIRRKRNIEPRQLYRNKIYEKYSHLGKKNFISYALRAAKILSAPEIKKQIKGEWHRLHRLLQKYQ